ncbi:MAG: PilZ domain-containing protein [Acidobacteria bacterium]|nr:PilZ domain-containing protein [Acidobacteriota bacterium]
MPPQADPPEAPPIESDRRKAARVSFEPMRVRVLGAREGILLDLSEGGALVLFPAAIPVGQTLTLQVEWDNGVLPVPVRVKRCLSRQVQLAAATLARTQYDVAVEFVDLPPDTRAAVTAILRKNSPEQ